MKKEIGQDRDLTTERHSSFDLRQKTLSHRHEVVPGSRSHEGEPPEPPYLWAESIKDDAEHEDDPPWESYCKECGGDIRL